jgi:hypothetical protein
MKNKLTDILLIVSTTLLVLSLFVSYKRTIEYSRLEGAVRIMEYMCKPPLYEAPKVERPFKPQA